MSTSPSPPTPPSSDKDIPINTECSKYLKASTCYQPRPICICITPQNKTYLQPLIICAAKCPTRYYHVDCMGLTQQHLVSTKPWFCPRCQPDQPAPPRICFCDKPPYTMGPIVQCKRKTRCKIRWFHWVCAGYPGDGGEWMCAGCIFRGHYGEEDDEENEEEQEADGALPSPKRARTSSNTVSDSLLLSAKDTETSPAELERGDANVSCRQDSAAPEPPYCFCGAPDNDEMVACDGKGCPREWFHYACVGLTQETVPKGKWFCDDCGVKKARVVKCKQTKNASRKRKR